MPCQSVSASAPRGPRATLRPSLPAQVNPLDQAPGGDMFSRLRPANARRAVAAMSSGRNAQGR
eukprot:8946108-Pyramimonas_sp.AAC.1